MKPSQSILFAALISFTVVSACSSTDETPPETERDMSQDASDTADDSDASDMDLADDGPDAENYEPPPVPEAPSAEATDESRALGFQLFYKERLSRQLLAHNRFQVVGGTTFGTSMGRGYIARNGDAFDVIGGPKDNDPIGTTVWNVYAAYRVFGTRDAELTLIRLLNGLSFLETVTGHPGLTPRQAYPGWTRTTDGSGGGTLTRSGASVASPQAYSPELEAEMAQMFWSGETFTYRENPEDFIFELMPGIRPGRYAVTHSFVDLAGVIRHTDCCSSLVRTPAEYDWAGAWWGNHNSRDNFPDLGLGFLAARLAASDADASQSVRDAASAALAAGERVGQKVVDNDMSLMTVMENEDYTQLEVSGTVRPYGVVENQDLGSLGACPMAYIALAMTGDLSTDEPVALPGSTDKELFSSPLVQRLIECPIEDVPTCDGFGDGYCSRPWSHFGTIEVQGLPFIEYFKANPGSAGLLLASWQNDFDDVVESSAALYHYAKATGDETLITEARDAVFYLTELQIALADVAYADDERRLKKTHYRAALYQAQVRLPVQSAHFGSFERAEEEGARMEALLEMADTPEILRTDAEIADLILEEIDDIGRRALETRYTDAYTDGPPVRRKGDGYEARGFPESALGWHDVETPRHQKYELAHLLDAIVLCEHAPEWVSCDWAKLGCEVPDLDSSGTVDGADRTLFDTALASAPTICNDANAWCGGADLNRDASADASDDAFMTAAQGCSY